MVRLFYAHKKGRGMKYRTTALDFASRWHRAMQKPNKNVAQS